MKKKFIQVLFILMIIVIVTLNIIHSKEQKSNEMSKMRNEPAMKYEDIITSYKANYSNRKIIEEDTYDIKRIDKFLKNCANKKNDKIRVSRYSVINDILVLSQMIDLEYDGNDIIAVNYDCLSSENYFKPLPAEKYTKIRKSTDDENIQYLLCNENENTDKTGILKFSIKSIK